MSELSTNGPDMTPAIPQASGAVSQYLEILNGPYYAQCVSMGNPPVWRISPKPFSEKPDPGMVYMEIPVPVQIAEEVIRNRKPMSLEEWSRKCDELRAKVEAGDLPARELSHSMSRLSEEDLQDFMKHEPVISDSTNVFGNPGCLMGDLADMTREMYQESKTND